METESQPTLLERQYSEEHLRFLRETNPKLLRKITQSGTLDQYLRTVGEQAASMEIHMMMQQVRSPAEMALPHLERMERLQGYRQAVKEIVQHDLIFQPVPRAQKG